MATTVPGGRYKSAVGDGYHDANGQVLSGPSTGKVEKSKPPAPASVSPEPTSKE